jgi:hypothetical protein
MLEFKWDNLDQALDALVKEEIEPIIRGLINMTWNGILVKTPQYHGRLVASWSFSIGSPEFVDRSDEVQTSPYGPNGYEAGPVQPVYRGHPIAINVANSYARGKDAAFRLGDVVWFANGADHGEGPYSVKIEEAEPFSLRQYNRPGKAVFRTLDMIKSRFSIDISPSNANRLKQTRIGGTS